ncbi:MAG: 30S ribosomal protein S20 [Planctomycetes bacterium]|nr:30S ribosomal protein S20 [Planctomycetota bacterium]
MAHSKQAQKRIRSSEKRRMHNKAIASRMRTEIKRVLAAVQNGDLDAAKAALPNAYSQVDRAAKTNIIHRNAAANRKSMLARAIARATS